MMIKALMMMAVLVVGVLARGAAGQGQLYNCTADQGIHCFPPGATYHGGDAYISDGPRWITEIAPSIMGHGRFELRINAANGALIWVGMVTTDASYPKRYPISVGRWVPQHFTITARSLPKLRPDWDHSPNWVAPPLPRIDYGTDEYATGVWSLPGYLTVHPGDSGPPPVSLAYGLAGALQTLHVPVRVDGPYITCNELSTLSLNILIRGQ